MEIRGRKWPWLGYITPGLNDWSPTAANSEFELCRSSESHQRRYSIFFSLQSKSYAGFFSCLEMQLHNYRKTETQTHTLLRYMQTTLNSLTSCLYAGKQLLPNGVCRYVDVRDVALAHVVAFENASASGRYCLVGRVAYLSEAFDILKQIFPSLNLPPM